MQVSLRVWVDGGLLTTRPQGGCWRSYVDRPPPNWVQWRCWWSFGLESNFGLIQSKFLATSLPYPQRPLDCPAVLIYVTKTTIKSYPKSNSPITLIPLGPTDPRIYGPSDLRTLGPSDLRTLGSADPRTFGTESQMPNEHIILFSTQSVSLTPTHNTMLRNYTWYSFEK